MHQNGPGQRTCDIFLDLIKAFDSGNHKILQDKLKHYGICGLALDPFISYVENRHQFVYANTVESDN